MPFWDNSHSNLFEKWKKNDVATRSATMLYGDLTLKAIKFGLYVVGLLLFYWSDDETIQAILYIMYPNFLTQ